MELLSPLLAHIVLVFVLMFLMGRSRINELKLKKTHMSDIALGQPNWTTKTTQISNSFNNQFQMPVLFYVVILLLLLTKQSDPWQLALAWAFVAFRYLHAIIHITSNRVTHRFYAYLIANALLLIMIVRFALIHFQLL